MKKQKGKSRHEKKMVKRIKKKKAAAAAATALPSPPHPRPDADVASPPPSPPAASETTSCPASPSSHPRPALPAVAVANFEKSSGQDRGLISYSQGLETYPNLSPRFEKQRENLSLNCGFDQTPTLKKILAHYADDYVPSAHQIVLHSLLPDSKARLKLRDVYSRVASSVVAVSSFFGVERKVDCSGFIINWNFTTNEGTILTSARVLCNPEKFSGYEFHVIVRMADGTLFLAKEDRVDFYHNILTLKVKSKTELNPLDLTADIVGRLRVTGLTERVVALGRSFCGYSFVDYVGELDQEYPSFGCSELLRSSCYASQICEGGPLITYTGDVVGVNFFGNGVCAHVLPAHIILSCLERWRTLGSVVMRPWFGFSVIDLKQAHFQICEKLHLTNREAHVLVNEVFEGSLAYKNDVRSYDLIVSLNGTRIESAHQYSELLSQGVIDSSSDSSPSFVVCINMLGRSKEVTFSAEYLSIDDTRFYDCWPELDGKECCREKIGSQENMFCLPPEEET